MTLHRTGPRSVDIAVRRSRRSRDCGSPPFRCYLTREATEPTQALVWFELGPRSCGTAGAVRTHRVVQRRWGAGVLRRPAQVDATAAL